MARRPTLGSHLEWHGSTIRVVVRVPPTLAKSVGSTKLKESLKTDSPKAAEALKWPVIAKLKAKLKDARKGTAGDPLTAEALHWKEAIADARANPDFHTYEDEQAGTVAAGLDLTLTLLQERSEELERSHGPQEAASFAALAKGEATPVISLLDAWILERRYSGAVENRQRLSVRRYEAWAREKYEPTHIEGISRKVAGKYVSHLMAQAIDPVTGNKALSALTNYWAWLYERGHFEGANPWLKQRITRKKSVRASDGGGAKRPFTTDEVKKLLNGMSADKPKGVALAMLDMSKTSALTGGRIGEIAELRVKHLDLKEGTVTLPGEKTENAYRIIPLHSELVSLLSSRANKKEPEGFLFQELPKQKSDARGRAAPVSQAFTRIRRKLKVDDVIAGNRQSRIDFHSWRRWFIRQAVEALEKGATGFTAWTIADVVGHSKEDGPLPMTMGRYPGKASMEAMRACVEAVALPNLKSADDDDDDDDERTSG